MGYFETHVEPALASLAPLRHSLDAWLAGDGMTEPPRAAVVLATHEAVANAIQHAGTPAPVLVRAESDSDGVVIEVSDDGNWKAPDNPRSEERGRGLTLIRSLVSDAQIKTGERGTTVRIHQFA
jgi:serine/threonine-protein kinase RsbW